MQLQRMVTIYMICWVTFGLLTHQCSGVEIIFFRRLGCSNYLGFCYLQSLWLRSLHSLQIFNWLYNFTLITYLDNCSVETLQRVAKFQSSKNVTNNCRNSWQGELVRAYFSISYNTTDHQRWVGQLLHQLPSVQPVKCLSFQQSHSWPVTGGHSTRFLDSSKDMVLSMIVF